MQRAVTLGAWKAQAGEFKVGMTVDYRVTVSTIWVSFKYIPNIDFLESQNSSVRDRYMSQSRAKKTIYLDNDINKYTI